MILIKSVCEIRLSMSIRFLALFFKTGFFCILLQPLYGQNRTAKHSIDIDKIMPLKIGDSIPEFLWHLPLAVVNHPEKADIITMSSYRDKKIVIIDFWATSCGSCIVSLNKLGSVAERFSDSFALLPITKQSKDEIIPFAEKRKWSFVLPVNDTVLHRVFPHRGIPHLVWIQDNQVIGVTDATYGTESNIVQLLAGKEPESVLYMYRQKNALDVSKGLTAQGGRKVYESMEICGYIPELEKGSRIMGGEKKIFIVNFSPKELIAKAYAIPPGDTDKYVFSELPDSIEFFIHPNQNASPFDKDKWRENYSISYQLNFPAATSRVDLLERMREDLNRYFDSNLGFYVSTDSKEIVSWVLSGVPNAHAFSKGMEQMTRINESSYIMRNQSLDQFVYHLKTSNKESNTPFVNESSYKGNVDITIDADLKDLISVQRELRKYGLSLVKEKRRLPVVILKISE